MTILEKLNKEQQKVEFPVKNPEPKTAPKEIDEAKVDNLVETHFEKLMEEFRANAGFSVDTGEQPVSTMIELLSSKWVNLPIIVLLAYIRYCINHGLKKEITVKIGYNKPASVPMNFAVNEEMVEEHYPSDVVEIN